MTATTTTARKLTVVRSAVAGWEVQEADGTVVTVAKNREQARALAKELAALPAAESFDAAVVAAEESGLTGDQLAELAQEQTTGGPVVIGLTEDDEDGDAAFLTEEDEAAQAELEARLAEEPADLGGTVDPEPALVAEKVPAQRKPRTPKAPKAEKAPKVEGAGETIVVRKMEKGQRIALRGKGTVTIVGRVRVEKLKFLVEFEDEAGEYGDAELWANARYRLMPAPTAQATTTV